MVLFRYNSFFIHHPNKKITIIIVILVFKICFRYCHKDSKINANWKLFSSKKMATNYPKRCFYKKLGNLIYYNVANKSKNRACLLLIGVDGTHLVCVVLEEVAPFAIREVLQIGVTMITLGRGPNPFAKFIKTARLQQLIYKSLLIV